MKRMSTDLRKVAAKLLVASGLIAANALIHPAAARADSGYDRCVWLGDGEHRDSCYRGCDAWIFTFCATDGSQGCYDASGVCS